MKQNQSVTAIILAAGQSRRMGRAKQLVPVDGVPMIVRAAETALASAADAVLVVTGAYADALATTLAPVEATAGDRLRRAHNARFADGQSTSVHAAVRALGGEVGAALFLPVDQPFVPTWLLDALIDAWRDGARLAAAAVDGQPRGAPAIFERALWPELLALMGDQGARPLLRRYAGEVARIEVAAALLRDVDTPADLAALSEAGS